MGSFGIDWKQLANLKMNVSRRETEKLRTNQREPLSANTDGLNVDVNCLSQEAIKNTALAIVLKHLDEHEVKLNTSKREGNRKISIDNIRKKLGDIKNDVNLGLKDIIKAINAARQEIIDKKQHGFLGYTRNSFFQLFETVLSKLEYLEVKSKQSSVTHKKPEISSEQDGLSINQQPCGLSP